eukprot:CAMPEP_0177444032 /NCGR_PEP_ID=MMETSP0369-20130122/5779_1 /TAXON_ID=447022 ORGANISM="Scrippsiella hangoei-like, Strain SHHI-4" /NCGR_SAMPLE_ID=MMETSP0369 /ASSEMBLY_ACC=CAM_ASM_000364 /LENGTH=624 /DNA_ID=CAMNT_0018916053 /DNA_START=8 /DNA_END=1879 /DNA_ORIENTATION=+
MANSAGRRVCFAVADAGAARCRGFRPLRQGYAHELKLVLLEGFGPVPRFPAASSGRLPLGGRGFASSTPPPAGPRAAEADDVEGSVQQPPLSPPQHRSRGVRISQTRSFEGMRIAILQDAPTAGGAEAALQTRANPAAAAATSAAMEFLAASEAPMKAAERFFKKVFLPIDYSTSVSHNYLPFIQFMTFQMLFSHISRVLATQAMLLAVGVGTGMALPLAAVTAWILKDGLGHLGAIAFGTFVNTRFDSDPKRFRFQAAALGKTADLLSIFTLARPEYFLLLSTLGSACGRISFSTAQSCRAKVYETFALRANLGDVLRCAQAQTVAAQLLGTGIGACIGPLVGYEASRLLAGNVIFSGASLYCAYRSSNVVEMATLNLQRSELIFHRLVKDLMNLEEGRASGGAAAGPGEEGSAEAALSALSIEDVRAREVFVSPYRSVFGGAELLVNPPMRAGCLMLTALAQSDILPYLLAFQASSSEASRMPTLVLWYHINADAAQTIQGFFHASVLRTLLERRSTSILAPGPPEQGGATRAGASAAEAAPGALADDVAALYRRSDELQVAWWPLASAALEAAGWRQDVAFLDARHRRVRVELEADLGHEAPPSGAQVASGPAPVPPPPHA